MNPPAIRSFAFRLTLLITAVSGLAAALVCTVLIVLHTRRVLDAATETASAHARVIAANTTAALDFDDEEAARHTLGGLAAVSEFAAAEITRPGGEVFARYDRGAPPPSPDPVGDLTTHPRPSPEAPVPADPAPAVPKTPLSATEPPRDTPPEPESQSPPKAAPVDTPTTPSILRTFPFLDEPHIEGRWLTVPQPIIRGGETIGHLTLLYDLAPARRRLLSDTAIAGAITLGVIGLAFIASQRLQRSLLRPVDELSRVAGAIAATDDYSIRARKYSSDELGILTDVFNNMIDRIGEAESLRRNHQAMLEREVQQRTEEILDAQARLRQTERLASLGTLSAGLGHDIGNLLMPLRSHLASIRARVEPLTTPAEDDFNAITQATEYLQNLSAGLRLLAQDPDKASTRREATPLAAWWPSIEPLLRAIVGRSVALHKDLPADLPRVRLAGNLLMQAVFNLVQNAVSVLAPEGEAPKPGARIEITARLAPATNAEPRVELSITDNGPGMTPEVVRRCVEPYFTTKTRRISSGLGLSLVKGIVESAGGELRIQSEPGRGATFTLILPAEPAAPPPAKTPAIVTIGDPRRRAIVSHLLKALNCEVESSPARAASGVNAASNADEAAASPAEPSPDKTSRAIWVTDSLSAIPAGWTGRIVYLGNGSPQIPAAADTITVDPATPLPRLRSILQDLLPGV